MYLVLRRKAIHGALGGDQSLFIFTIFIFLSFFTKIYNLVPGLLRVVFSIGMETEENVDPDVLWM